MEVNVDEYIPCFPKNGRPMFCRPNGNEAWVLIIEKAMAKLWGSYSALHGGFEGVAFRVLTGAKNVFLWNRRGHGWKKLALSPGDPRKPRFYNCNENAQNNTFFRTLQKADRVNFMLSAAMGRGPRSDGLVGGHAYSLLHVMEVHGWKLLCLRNPWGNAKEWNGDWSDKSRMWDVYPAVKARLRPRQEDDGCFWMSWKDFSRVWDHVEVCCRAMRTGNEALAHTQASVSGSIAMLPAKPRRIRRIVQHSKPTKKVFADGKEELVSPTGWCGKRKKPEGRTRAEDDYYKDDIDKVDSMLFKKRDEADFSLCAKRRRKA